MTDGGGWGNVAGAVAEAAFMTGERRRGSIVRGDPGEGSLGRWGQAFELTPRAPHATPHSLAHPAAALPASCRPFQAWRGMGIL